MTEEVADQQHTEEEEEAEQRNMEEEAEQLPTEEEAEKLPTEEEAEKLQTEEEQQPTEEEQQQDGADSTVHDRPQLPTGRVKKIMKLDKDINKVNAEALFLVTRSTELFLQFLAEKSAEIATQQKRKTIKVDYLHLAVKNHQPTRDFLLDSFPEPTQPLPDKSRARPVLEKPAPPRNRRIESFFTKPATDSPTPATDVS